MTPLLVLAEIFYESQFGSYLYGIIFAAVFAFATGVIIDKLRKDHRFMEGWQKAVLIVFGVVFGFIVLYNLYSMTQPVDGSISISEKEIVIHNSEEDDLVIPKELIITWGMAHKVRERDEDKEIWDARVVGYKNLRINYYESAADAASYDKHGKDIYLDLMLYEGEDQLKMHDLMEKFYPRGKE